MKKSCSHCGLYNWACGCGGHCYNALEHFEWHRLYGKGKFVPLNIYKPNRRRKISDFEELNK